MCGLLFSLIVPRCFSEPELARYIEQVKARPIKPIERLPEFQKLQAFNYPDSSERRNPFKVLLPRQENIHVISSNQKVKSSLDNFSLDELNVVGILRQEERVWALIRQPDNVIVHASVGDYIGRTHARITQILENKINLLEERVIAGQLKKMRRTLCVN